MDVDPSLHGPVHPKPPVQWSINCQESNYPKFLQLKGLTLRREAGVKLTPDPINRLIFKNGFNLCKPNFVTFNIFSLAFISDT